MTDGNDLNAVIAKAKRLAKKFNETYYVVRENDHNGIYHVASDFDLDTWYRGISDSNILFATE